MYLFQLSHRNIKFNHTGPILSKSPTGKTFPLHDTPSSLLPQQTSLIPVQASLLEKASLTTHILPSNTSLTSTLLSQPASQAPFPSHTSLTCTLPLAHQPHKHSSPRTPTSHAPFSLHTSLTSTLTLAYQPHMQPSPCTSAFTEA